MSGQGVAGGPGTFVVGTHVITRGIRGGHDGRQAPPACPHPGLALGVPEGDVLVVLEARSFSGAKTGSPPPPSVRGRSQGGEKPMATTADGGKESKGRAANGDRPVGAARCRRDHHTQGVMPYPPPPSVTAPGPGPGPRPPPAISSSFLSLPPGISRKALAPGALPGHHCPHHPPELPRCRAALTCRRCSCTEACGGGAGWVPAVGILGPVHMEAWEAAEASRGGGDARHRCLIHPHRRPLWRSWTAPVTGVSHLLKVRGRWEGGV